MAEPGIGVGERMMERGPAILRDGGVLRMGVRLAPRTRGVFRRSRSARRRTSDTARNPAGSYFRSVSVEITIQPAAALAVAFAARVEAWARQAQAASGRFAVALPGGSVATTVFPELAQLPLDWSAVEFFWGDERAVPPQDPESNYGVADRLLLSPARVPRGRIHRLPADSPDLDAAAREAERDLIDTLGTPPRLDLALLGMGPDGHVCSLFPGHPLLAEEDRWVAAI